MHVSLPAKLAGKYFRFITELKTCHAGFKTYLFISYIIGIGMTWNLYDWHFRDVDETDFRRVILGLVIPIFDFTL